MYAKWCYAKERNYTDKFPSRDYSLAIRGDLSSNKSGNNRNISVDEYYQIIMEQKRKNNERKKTEK